jgi:hypothetical protein
MYYLWEAWDFIRAGFFLGLGFILVFEVDMRIHDWVESRRDKKEAG